MHINNEENNFKKSGKEFKEVLAKKIAELESRIKKRNLILEELLKDKRKLRSYLLRSSGEDQGKVE